MTEQVRYRIDKRLVREAERICKDIGLAPSQAVAMFFAQLVKLRAVPFRPSQLPALEEYGVTAEEAEAAERRALKEIQAQRKAGKVLRFTGKLA